MIYLFRRVRIFSHFDRILKLKNNSQWGPASFIIKDVLIIFN